MDGTERLTRRKETLRRMIVTRYLWMFVAVAVTIVGTGAIDTGSTLSATIEAVALADTVLYRASWSDLSAMEQPPLLTIELESQFGTTSLPLSEETKEGAFTSLRRGTLYTLRVLADRGFGGQVLATQTVRTTTGAAAGVTVTFPTVDLGHGETLLSPTMDVWISDSDEEYVAWRLLYQIFEPNASSTEIEDLTSYEIVPITSQRQTVTTYNLYPMNQLIAIRLEGQSSDGTWTVFDARLLRTPLTFEASLYVTSWFPDAIGFYAYAHDPLELDAVFEAELWRDGNLMDRIRILPQTEEYDSTLLWFRGLRRTTEYTLRYVVEYRDPSGGGTVRKVLSETVVQTPDRYSFEGRVSIENGQIVFDLTLDDPAGLLTNFAYSVFDPATYEYASDFIVFTDSDGKKHATFSIPMIQPGPKRISITAMLEIDSDTTVTTSLFHDTIE
jgi:hypothetical protein